MFNQKINLSLEQKTINRKARWHSSALIVAPQAGDEILSIPVQAGMHGYVVGYRLGVNGEDENVFRVSWKHRGTLRFFDVIFVSGGTTKSDALLSVAENEGEPADPDSQITVSILNNASPDVIYSARLCVATEEI